MSERGRIGIVGGSIGGCAAAISLSRSGWDVDVFERSDRDLVARGAGIATLTPLLDALIARDLVGGDLPRFDARPTRWVARDATVRSGRLFGTDPLRLPMSTLTWGHLSAHLRTRVPSGVYERGRTVAQIDASAPRPTVRFADGSRRDYDLVVCADGYRSLGRSTLFPDAALRYRGYVLWRGIVAEGSVDGTAMLEQSALRCGYLGGHGVFYLVPAAAPDDNGAREINWGLYLQVPQDELTSVLTDRFGRTAEGSVAAGMLAPEQEAAFKAQAVDLLPTVLADVVDASRDTSIQAIFTVTVPEYRRGRVCLVGDAGTLYPPFTGSGVFNAVSNALELAVALDKGADIDACLAAWSDRQLRALEASAAAAEVLERAFIFEMPDLAGFDDDEFAAWNSAVWAQLPPPPAPGAPSGTRKK